MEHARVAHKAYEHQYAEIYEISLREPNERAGYNVAAIETEARLQVAELVDNATRITTQTED